jgi:hypothetical protein
VTTPTRNFGLSLKAAGKTAMRLLPIIATAASLAAVSAAAQNAPDSLERPAPTTWSQKLVAHLNKYKRNTDRDAEVVVRFALDRAGHVIFAKVEKTSGLYFHM